MFRIRTRSLATRVSLIAGAVLALAGVAGPSHAALTLKTSRADLGGNDFIDWGVLGPEFTMVTNPLAILSNGGLPLQVSIPAGPFMRLDQSDSYAIGWHGNFAPGDHLLWTLNHPGPITLDFASPIMGGGAQIQRDYQDIFTGTIEAFDGDGMSLGSFSLPGNSTNANDNSALFLGVVSDSANIKKLVFNEGDGDFAINRTDLLTGNRSPAQDPEPSALALLGSGLISLVARRRRTGA